MKVWITKYALTSGIRETDGTVGENCPSMICVKPIETAFAMTEYFHGSDWHTDKESAIKRAKEMQAAKIKSIEKAIAKIKKKVFV